MARLSVQLLGPFQVALDGEPVTHFRAETAQALLAYLAMHADAACRRPSSAACRRGNRPLGVTGTRDA